MRGLRRWWWVLLLVPILVIVGFVAWATIIPRPMPEALDALQSTPQVEVTVGDWLVFQPIDQEPRAGLVLYPGARVNPKAYAPAARAISAEGYLVVIVPMPLNLAFLGADRAYDVIDAFPWVGDWAVGGHSLGGAMAARFAHGHPLLVDGLVLWAAYPPQGDDLSGRDLAVASVYGTRDGLASQEEIDSSRELLPPDTRWVAIEGGNHAQFGWYGEQSGDNEATITREAQQQQIVEATLELLRGISPFDTDSASATPSLWRR